ncbi:MAG TPA: hypothetical protein VH951_12370 [Dehalococcoidia bacterium]|jgi:hypothetical protein
MGDTEAFGEEPVGAYWKRWQADRELQRRLIDALPDAWSKTAAHRDRVLHFLALVHPAAGFRYAVAGLEDPSRTVRGTAIIATMSYAHEGFKFDEALVARLKAITFTRRDHFQGIFAIDALDAVNPPGFEDWLFKVALSNLQWEVRKEALLRLLDRSKREALAIILAEFPLHPEDDWLAEPVWRRAKKWQLGEDEQEVLIRGARRHMQKMRSSADRWGPDDSPSAMRYVVNWILEGIEPGEGDSDRIRIYIEGCTGLNRRKISAAIRALGRIPDPTATAALADLQSHRFAYVRDAARRALVDSSGIA